MWKRYGRLVVIPLLLLGLAGCHQQAGEAFQPVSNTETPLNLPDLDASGEMALTSFPATATLPPITIIAPTRPGLPTPEPAEAQLELPTFEPAAPDEPLPGIEGEPADPDEAEPLEAPTLALEQPGEGVFRTPVSPLGPVTPVLPTPTPLTVIPAVQPLATASGLVTPTALPDDAGECTYTVRPGDNLFRISVNHNVTLAEMRAANPQISGDLLQPGQALRIPGCVPGAPASPDTAVTIPDTAIEQPPVAVPAEGTTYTVQTNDTLFSIARRFNTTVQAIVQANNLSNPDRLSVGQQLIIPAPAN